MNNIVNQSSRQLSSASGTGRTDLAVVQQQAMACRTMADAIAAPTMAMVVREHGAGAVGVAMSAIMQAGMEYFAHGRRMSAGQMMLFAEDLLDRYKHESLADVALFMRNCALSKYDDGEFYNSVDVPRLNKWWKRYLEEKAAERELIGERWEHEQEQMAKGMIANIPGLKQAVREFTIDARLKAAEEGAIERMRRLEEQLPKMSVDELRDAYRLHTGAKERSAIIRDAQRRGLLGHDVVTTDGK